MTRLSLLTVLSLLLSAIAPAIAQDAPPPENATYRLEPRKVEGIAHGKAALVTGRVGDKPHRFFLENLNMLVPVVVTLRPGSKNADLHLSITKFAWDQALREADARDGKQTSFKFRTQGEFQIAVRGAKPETPYKLLVWVGDEVKPDFKPVVVSKAAFEKDQGGKPNWLMWVIAIALVGILGLLAVLVLRRKRA